MSCLPKRETTKLVTSSWLDATDDALMLHELQGSDPTDPV